MWSENQLVESLNQMSENMLAIPKKYVHILA